MHDVTVGKGEITPMDKFFTYRSLPAVSHMPTLKLLPFDCIVFEQNAAPIV
jgi:hypothetical protein